MKKAKRQLAKVEPPLRTFNLHASFTPNGPEANDAGKFVEFWQEAKERTQELRMKELRRRKTRMKKLQAAVRKTQPIVRKVLRNEVSVEVAAQKIKRLAPDKDLAGELFDHWKKAAAATPATVARQKKKIVRDKADLRRRERLRKAGKAVHRGLCVLMEAVMAGDADAAEDLADAAISATRYLYLAERSSPDVFSRVARAQIQWPVLASEEAGWEKDTVRRVAELDLGANLQIFKVRFRRARGTDANLPARLWAKAAVRVAEETRWRMFTFAQLGSDFDSSEAFADFCVEAGWRLGSRPKWINSAAELEVFSQATLPKWKRVIRQIIREAMPDFHTQPEWANQRRTAVANERDSVGEIQNAILDDIVSALARLAPGKPC
jgi:hypothetical protein